MSQEINCPKCKSNQITANKKGFSVGNAAAGALLTGGVGLLAGTIGSGKVIITCLSCGHQFKPGGHKETAVEQYHRLKERQDKIYAERNAAAIEENKRQAKEYNENPDKQKASRNAVVKVAAIIIIFGILSLFFSTILGFSVIGFGLLLFIAAFF